MAPEHTARIVSLADVLKAASTRPSAHVARVLAIDGPSAAGKSTLARRLRALRPNTALIKCDDFVSWTDLETWWPRFEAEVLDPLRSGASARYQVRDWIGDEFGASVKGWKSTPASPLVIVEGVGAARAQAHADFAIWVEAPPAVRLERGLRRDGADHTGVWRRWQRMEQEFFERDGTRRRADLRVDGAPTVAHDPATQAVLLAPDADGSGAGGSGAGGPAPLLPSPV